MSAKNVRNYLPLLNEAPTKDLSDYLPHKEVQNTLKNMLDNQSSVSNKVVLFSGKWGTGKTSILKSLEEEFTGSKTFIWFDAWTAPFDMLVKNFLRQFLKETEQSTKLVKKVDTVKKSRFFVLPKTSIFIYLSIFLLIPLLKDVFPKYIDNNAALLISSIVILMIITLSSKKWTQTLMPFLTGANHEYTEYSETTDISCGKLEEILKAVRQKSEKEIESGKYIIVIDNLDRLSREHQKPYIDALYVFLEKILGIFEDKNIWTIVAIDKTQLNDHPEISADFFDKISPYEITLPTLNEEYIHIFIAKAFQYLTLPFDIPSDMCRYFSNTYLTLGRSYFPKELLEKTTVKLSPILFTPRTVKKVINQMIIAYNQWCDKFSKEHELMVINASFLYGCAQTFNQEAIFKDYLINIQEYLSRGKGGVDLSSIEDKKQQQDKSPITDQDEWQALINIFTNTLFNRDYHDDKYPIRNEILLVLLQQKMLLNASQIQILIEQDNFKTSLLSQFITFGFTHNGLQQNIQKAVYMELNKGKPLNEILNFLYSECKDRQDFSIFAQTFSTNIFDSYAQSEDFKGDIITDNMIGILLCLYIRGTRAPKQQELLFPILQQFVNNSSHIKFYNHIYDNRGRIINLILKHFNDHADLLKKETFIQNLIITNIVSAVAAESYSFNTRMVGKEWSYHEFYKLSLDVRAQIWKLVPKETVNMIIDSLKQLDIHDVHLGYLLSIFIEIHKYTKVDQSKLNELIDLYEKDPNNGSVHSFGGGFRFRKYMNFLINKGSFLSSNDYSKDMSSETSIEYLIQSIVIDLDMPREFKKHAEVALEEYLLKYIDIGFGEVGIATYVYTSLHQRFPDDLKQFFKKLYNKNLWPSIFQSRDTEPLLKDLKIWQNEFKSAILT